jgi:peptidoglycan/xylan/chitin deacetylase (PgdA/CDA1 family)
VLERLPKRRALIVLNYHRIGNTHESLYDPDTFSATTEELERQIVYLKRRFHIATLEETMAIAEGRSPRTASVLITFDDGYLDNYTVAFPLLRLHGVQGVFFLPTSFIGTNHLPWWDLIAYTIRHSRAEVVRLNYPEPGIFDLSGSGKLLSTRKILQLYKHPDMLDQDRFFRELKVACGYVGPPNMDRCFLNWQEAREMQQAGMAFGSHTHRHEILSKLSAAEEREELSRSRQILERELGGRVEALAYPVGLRHTFCARTQQALRDSGYRAAFSFYGGVNQPGRIDPLEIRRFGVGDQSHARLRLQTTLGALTGAWWF